MRAACIALSLSLAHAVLADLSRAGDAGLEHFESKVRPLLVEHCYECHSTQAKKLGGNLLLDSRDGIRQGGDSGASLVPGKPEESLLVAAIRYSADAVHMPPTGKLPDQAIADLEAWIKMGAPDPREKASSRVPAESWEATLGERRQWWSMQPVVRPAVPAVQNTSWSTQPVDRFVLAALEQRGLAPVAAADPRTLARRLSLVLTGLPPTPEQMAQFLRECEEASLGSPTRNPSPAITRFVDSLLASPHFGERFARHWMDVVRFSETHGNEWNYEVHHAWRYRDYLIRAFNADVPYDQLVREHIAGDLLPVPRINQRERFNESVIGTAFYRFGEANHDDCISLPQIGYDLADNEIDTLTKAFQATTVACARCHNHKLDAVSTEDYYALLGIVRSSRRVSHTIDTPDVNAATIARLRALKDELRRELATIWLRDVRQLGAYLQAAALRRANASAEIPADLDAGRLEKCGAVLAVEKAPREDLFEPWRKLATAAFAASADAEGAKAWTEWREWYARQEVECASNEAQFHKYADFRQGTYSDWQVDGQGLRKPPQPPGDFLVSTEGEFAVQRVLPAGCFTNSISDKLNGTLRSPVLANTHKHISFQVAGLRSSAVRLVSNNCQLNYKNYKALISGDLAWITFTLPDDCASLRTYAELMTMFDNPKFPDQLSALGGDKENYKLPWERAAANPRSFFGVTRVVTHDGAEPPPPELSHLRPLFAGEEAPTLATLATRYETIARNAVQAWGAGGATDDDARWLDALLKSGLLTNSTNSSERIAALVAEYRTFEAELALPRVVPGVADFGPGFDQPVLVRGDCLRPGDRAPRRYLEVFSAPGETFDVAGSGRRELAERLASPANPLTARVMVNRVWHHLFGAGLVRTVDDFGHVGELPSHPELLDYLAATFVEEGWSVKRLVRTLVLTQTFRTGHQPAPTAAETDPQNRLLSHYPARRLEAESIRDGILAASGRLDRTLFGYSIQPFRDKENADRRLFPGPLDGNGRRSVYIKNNLMEAPKFLGAFDFPGGKVARGRRDVTNVPAQALALLNDPFVVAEADRWAAQMIAGNEASVANRIEGLFDLALNRPPREDERQRFEQIVAELAGLHQVPATDVLRSAAVWRDVAHTIFNLQEFVFIP